MDIVLAIGDGVGVPTDRDLGACLPGTSAGLKGTKSVPGLSLP
jgi:hypothetical protein